MSEAPADGHDVAQERGTAPGPEDSPAAPLAAAPLPATADPRVDDALSRLAEVETLPLAEQVAVYSDIHRRLAGVLSDPDSQA